MFKTSILIFSSISLLSACASTNNNFVRNNTEKSKPSNISKTEVKWPGLIVKTVNTKKSTCFEIIETLTDLQLHPKKILHPSNNKFFACQDGYMDAKDYNNKLVTVSGQLVTFSKLNSGDENYVYPIVEANTINIWNPKTLVSNRFSNSHNTRLLFFVSSKNYNDNSF